MMLFQLPWLDLAIAIPLGGAMAATRARSVEAAYRWSKGTTAIALVTAVLAGVGFEAGFPQQSRILENGFALDSLSALLFPLASLLHFLTVLSTARNKAPRFSFTGTLAGESLRLAIFACTEPWPLIALLTVETLIPYFEKNGTTRSLRLFAWHMGAYIALLMTGWACVEGRIPGGRGVGSALLLAAVLVRCGAVPVHTWLASLFARGAFSASLLFATPMTGVYAAVRLVVPIAPDWILQSLGVVSLVTAAYAAGMAVVQRDARRFFAFLFLSNASLVLVGLELHTSLSLTGALALWASAALALSGLGFTLRAVEARLGQMPLDRFVGLYDHSPGLAVGFLLTGLASVGFPCTLGYVAADLLVEGAVETHLALGIIVVLATAINGIAIVRAYLLLFTGRRHESTAPLAITGRERAMVLAVASLILGGGFVPQLLVVSRHAAAQEVLNIRFANLGPDL
ncbi:MAG TPA: proton-conducting transporter membrane subunit [Urbifossiella sp.]|nr:proton-conducting transporter membrane subunit [Urbifossiella sp.]